MDSTGRGREDRTLSKREALGELDIVEVKDHDETPVKGRSGDPEDSTRDLSASKSLSRVHNSDGRRRSLEKGENIQDVFHPDLESTPAKRDGDLLPTTPSAQEFTSPSDDVSLNMAAQDVEEQGEGIINSRMKPDALPNEERRVAFLPPPRLSPVFIPPRSSYPIGNPPIGSAYGTPPMGQIGVHYPREIIRIERDYSGGELVQFYSIYPMELEGRITPTQWLDTVNGINEILISAHSLKHAAFHHVLAVFTLYVSTLMIRSHYDKEMNRLQLFIDECNKQLYHSQGLNILWPRSNGLMFMEIEYY